MLYARAIGALLYICTVCMYVCMYVDVYVHTCCMYSLLCMEAVEGKEREAESPPNTKPQLFQRWWLELGCDPVELFLSHNEQGIAGCWCGSTVRTLLPTFLLLPTSCLPARWSVGLPLR